MILNLTHIGHPEFDFGSFVSPRNQNDPNPKSKPLGGFWAYPSRTIENALTKGEAFFHFTIIGRVAVISSKWDVAKLPHRQDAPQYLDWETITLEYDAIWLTDRGVKANLTQFKGWDKEAVLVVNPESIEGFTYAAFYAALDALGDEIREWENNPPPFAINTTAVEVA